MPLEDFDAVLFHLRSWDRNDLPDKRYLYVIYLTCHEIVEISAIDIF